MMKNFTKILAAGLVLFGITSCDNVLDIAPEDFFADGNFWQNETQVNNFMTGIHNDLRGHQFMFFRLGEMRGGALTSTPRMDVSLSELNIINHSLTEVAPGIATWAGFMNSILQIN